MNDESHAMPQRLAIEHFFDEDTSTFSYIVLDRGTLQCALIDSVLDYDPKSGRTGTVVADRLIARVRALGAQVQWLLETHVHDGVSEEAFVALRRARDATLPMPVLMLPAVQVNMRAGQLPPAEDNGVRYVKIPLDVL